MPGTWCRLRLYFGSKDIHHRQGTHGWNPDPIDDEVRLNDRSYEKVRQSVRRVLAEAVEDQKFRQQFGLLFQAMKDQILRAVDKVIRSRSRRVGSLQ